MLLTALCATLLLHAQQPRMRDLFATMPDSVLPQLTRNNRLDCIDFIENGMEARVRDRMENAVVLEVLTAAYMRLRTTEHTIFEARLLPLSGGGCVVAIVSTVELGSEDAPASLRDSHLSLADTAWHELSPGIAARHDAAAAASGSAPAVPFALPPVQAFLAPSAVMTPDVEAAVAALTDVTSVHIALDPDVTDVTLTVQTAFLDSAQRRAVEGILQPVTLHWDGSSFTP